jgi:branched-chain amino acid transport system ATP-binding protein
MLDRLLGPRDAGLTASANQMIEFFRLSHVADEKAGGLSYGQQKLLDAAMAFMAGPRLVLLDEPAGGVNLTMLGHLRDRLKAINTEQNATFVVIEHNMEFVMALCNRIIVLAEGKIIAEGTPDEIRSNPEVIEEAMRAMRAQRSLTQKLMGDPAPHRSALGRSGMVHESGAAGRPLCAVSREGK